MSQQESGPEAAQAAVQRLVYSAMDRLQFDCVSSVQMSVGAGAAAFKHLLLIPTHAVLVMITGQSGFAASVRGAGRLDPLTGRDDGIAFKA